MKTQTEISVGRRHNFIHMSGEFTEMQLERLSDI